MTDYSTWSNDKLIKLVICCEEYLSVFDGVLERKNDRIDNLKCVIEDLHEAECNTCDQHTEELERIETEHIKYVKEVSEGTHSTYKELLDETTVNFRNICNNAHQRIDELIDENNNLKNRERTLEEENEESRERIANLEVEVGLSGKRSIDVDTPEETSNKKARIDKPCVYCRGIDKDGTAPAGVLSCGHQYHETCFEENNFGTNGFVSCPGCRRTTIGTPTFLEQLEQEHIEFGGLKIESLFE